MTRKFIQMGMTRSKRYANYKGGRKYVDGKGNGNMIGKSKGHEGKAEKEEASRIFKEVWERCRVHEGYLELKKDFLRDQKEWLKTESQVKSEVEQETDPRPKREHHGSIKLEDADEREPSAQRKRINVETD